MPVGQRKSEHAVVKLHQTRAASHTIIGAISTKDAIHIALRKPPPPPPPPAKDTKKRAKDNLRQEEGSYGNRGRGRHYYF
ncbi:hypothetical protein CU097_007208 [Rhizopus azygosporus]|uniref:Uncharacterized protein n=1 Tax=Rhizopus azygosporus TaxID=86630 RepID=A0A367J6E5_RHIAZ|nr:hypothetical protein CU097_007208 [Rhizopus azygosporus]